MILPAFAAAHRLRLRRDEDGTPVVPGRYGFLAEHGDDRLAVVYMGQRWPCRIPRELNTGSRRRWANRRRACIAAGMQLVQDGDDEGVLAFDPANAEQVRLALRVAGVRPRRVLSDAQREVLARATAAANLSRRGPPNGEKSPISPGVGAG